jgi:hypothetical protein
MTNRCIQKIEPTVRCELLKEHRKVKKLEATVASLVAVVKEQASQIHEVRAQVEVRGPLDGD